MIKLTKEEADKCWGYFEAAEGQLLKHGDTGYYTDHKGLTLITCCNGCGEYSRQSIDMEVLLCLTGLEPKYINAN